MEKVFEIRTEPHVAVIGGTRLLFQPETIGAAFAGAYGSLRAAQVRLTAAGDNIGEAELSALNEGMREFVGRFLLNESKADFDALVLPDRVLVQLLEFAAELYSAGAGPAENPTDAPGGQSSAS